MNFLFVFFSKANMMRQQTIYLGSYGVLGFFHLQFIIVYMANNNKNDNDIDNDDGDDDDNDDDMLS